MPQHDFGAMHAAMQRHVDGEILPGISSAILRGREVVDRHCTGWADREAKVPLREDHIFRAFSNTKLVTAIAVMQLVEGGRLGPGDPVERTVPQLANRRVLRPGATHLDDTEPAVQPITIRHLLSHSAGLGYGFLDPEAPLSKAYARAQVLSPATTLAAMMEALAPLPLLFQPGSSWTYSVASDVLSRVVEVVSGEAFDRCIRRRILDPLGMADTGFVVPQDKQDRLTAFYAGASLLDPRKPGLTPLPDAPWPGAYLRPVPRLAGGSGLVTTLPDMVALLRALLPDGPTILAPQTLAEMMRNQLPAGCPIRFNLGDVPGKGFGLGGAVTLKPSSIDPPGAEGEFQWGGVAGTHWWISPQTGTAGVLMTQRQMGFWNPFFFELKALATRAALKG